MKVSNSDVHTVGRHSPGAIRITRYVKVCYMHVTKKVQLKAISRRNAITRAALQNLDSQTWKSRISISTKYFTLYTLHFTHLPVRFRVLGSYQEGCTQD